MIPSQDEFKKKFKWEKNGMASDLIYIESQVPVEGRG